MNKMILAAVVSMAATTAFAKATTEYYFQPAAGAHAVKIDYRMGSAPAKTETAGGVESDYKITTNDLYLDYGYGLNETTALGAYIFNGSAKTTVGTKDTTASGMGDLHLYYKGFADMIHWGVDLGVNMGKAKADKRGTGGLSIAANVGVLANSAEWNYGGDLKFVMPMERTTEAATAGQNDEKITGGNLIKLAGFAEYNYGMGFLGAELAYNMLSDRTEKATAGETKYKGEGFLSLTGNASYDFNDMATGLLSIGLENHSEHDETDGAGSAKVKAYMGTNVALGVRLNF